MQNNANKKIRIPYINDKTAPHDTNNNTTTKPAKPTTHTNNTNKSTQLKKKTMTNNHNTNNNIKHTATTATETKP